MAKELSIFVDESGDRGGMARYYLLTLVFHDQADSIMDEIRNYKERLSRSGLPDIAFHFLDTKNELLGVRGSAPNTEGSRVLNPLNP